MSDLRTVRRVVCFFALSLISWSAWSDAPRWHHVHLLATDTKAAADWYGKFMEGEPRKVAGGAYDAVVFGSTMVVFKQAEPGFAGSDGSTIDHIGFSFTDLEAKMGEFQAEGIKIIAPSRSLGQIKFGFIEDPWGTKIEVMQDPDLIGFHHVHYHTADPDGMIAWHIAAFGGEATKFGGFLPAIQYGEIWFIFQKHQDKAPTEGRSIDHLGWRVEDIEAETERLKAMGVTFQSEPAPFRETGAKVAFFSGPGGLRFEFVQPPRE
jgi:catechol 2,3-dioxygenase-like lactoylglutathione lyase family enzyme